MYVNRGLPGKGIKMGGRRDMRMDGFGGKGRWKGLTYRATICPRMKGERIHHEAGRPGA